jgi:hypothetical protein
MDLRQATARDASVKRRPARHLPSSPVLRATCFLRHYLSCVGFQKARENDSRFPTGIALFRVQKINKLIENVLTLC